MPRSNRALHEYFDVLHLNEIRASPRYRSSVAPLFRGKVILSLDADCNLVVVGTWADRDEDQPGVYTLATHGPDAGHYVRSAVTF